MIIQKLHAKNAVKEKILKYLECENLLNSLFKNSDFKNIDSCESSKDLLLILLEKSGLKRSYSLVLLETTPLQNYIALYNSLTKRYSRPTLEYFLTLHVALMDYFMKRKGFMYDAAKERTDSILVTLSGV